MTAPVVTAPVITRRDALPLWVTALLVFFLVLRVGQVATLPRGQAAGPAAQSVDTDSMQDLIQADLMAKFAYAATLATPGPTATPDPRYLRQALTAAEALQAETHNEPGAARRLILLRALSGAPPLSAGPRHLDPLAAFTTALPADTPPPDKAQYAAEGRLWKQAFGGRLTPHQSDALASQIRALPNIRWWQWPALSAVYLAQRDPSEANRYALQARSHALGPLLSTSVLLLLRGLLMLVGLLIGIYLLLRLLDRSRKVKRAADADLWPTLPERQPFSERRLGAGDLAAVFVVYLLSREVLELLLVGFPGFGASHLAQFPGLLTPFLGTLRRLPAAERSSLNVVLEAATYLLSAAPPLLYLRAMARQRGASLADELGWGTRALGANVGYGVAGFALASVLIVAVALPASHLLRHLPAPSNPVIPQLVGTTSPWATLLLVALASVAAPLVEELLFRGVLYNACKLRLGVWPAIVLSGLVFGFVHPVGVAEMLAIAVLGGVFAWMAETRKSLAPSITAHFLNNFTSTLLLLFALAG